MLECVLNVSLDRLWSGRFVEEHVIHDVEKNVIIRGFLPVSLKIIHYKRSNVFLLRFLK